MLSNTNNCQEYQPLQWICKDITVTSRANHLNCKMQHFFSTTPQIPVTCTVNKLYVRRHQTLAQTPTKLMALHSFKANHNQHHLLPLQWCRRNHSKDRHPRSQNLHRHRHVRNRNHHRVYQPNKQDTFHYHNWRRLLYQIKGKHHLPQYQVATT